MGRAWLRRRAHGALGGSVPEPWPPRARPTRRRSWTRSFPTFLLWRRVAAPPKAFSQKVTCAGSATWQRRFCSGKTTSRLCKPLLWLLAMFTGNFSTCSSYLKLAASPHFTTTCSWATTLTVASIRWICAVACGAESALPGSDHPDSRKPRVSPNHSSVWFLRRMLARAWHGQCVEALHRSFRLSSPCGDCGRRHFHAPRWFVAVARSHRARAEAGSICRDSARGSHLRPNVVGSR